MSANDLSEIRGVIWDMDGTLYKFREEFVIACNRAAAQTLLEMGLQKTEAEAYEIATRSYHAHGHSFHLFEAMGFKYADYHDPFHARVATDSIIVIDGLKEAIEAIPKNMVVLTNASKSWQKKILPQIGLAHLFDDHAVHCLEDFNFNAKAYHKDGFLLARSHPSLRDIKSEHILMVEDSARNLIIPYKMGMRTALVHAEIRESDKAYVHHHYPEVIDLAYALK